MGVSRQKKRGVLVPKTNTKSVVEGDTYAASGELSGTTRAPRARARGDGEPPLIEKRARGQRSLKRYCALTSSAINLGSILRGRSCRGRGEAHVH